MPTWIAAFGGVDLGVEGAAQQAMSQGESKGAHLAAEAAIGNLSKGAHSSMYESITSSKNKIYKAAEASSKAGSNPAGAANADSVGGQVAATEKAGAGNKSELLSVSIRVVLNIHSGNR